MRPRRWKLRKSRSPAGDSRNPAAALELNDLMSGWNEAVKRINAGLWASRRTLWRVAWKTSLRPKKKNGHTDTVLDSAGRGAEKYVGKETVSMCAHRHQVAPLVLNPFD